MTLANQRGTCDGRSLYIHVPFCRHRCGYCNFSLIAGRDDLIGRFIHAIEIEAGQVTDAPDIDTLFLGGGTPSHLGPVHLNRLFAIVQDNFSLAKDAEISIECNPADLDIEKRDAIAELGVNRISFGVQSFRDAKLQLLERDHRKDQILAALELAKAVTDNVSLDLIFATPGESIEQWEADLDCAIACSPAHLSTYELTIEKGTQFWNRQFHGALVVPNEDERYEFYVRTIKRLEDAGYLQYEISSFCRPGFRCQHNTAYWNGSDYYALGPGAASYVDGVRRINHRSTTTYLNQIESSGSAVTATETLTAIEQAIDLVVFGLRQTDGIDFESVVEKTGCDLMLMAEQVVQRHIELGLISLDGTRLFLTRKGISLYDNVSQDWFDLL